MSQISPGAQSRYLVPGRRHP